MNVFYNSNKTIYKLKLIQSVNGMKWELHPLIEKFCSKNARICIKVHILFNSIAFPMLVLVKDISILLKMTIRLMFSHPEGNRRFPERQSPDFG